MWWSILLIVLVVVVAAVAYHKTADRDYTIGKVQFTRDYTG